MEEFHCQLLNVHGVNDFRQTQLHTSKPLVCDPSSFKVKIPIEKLKRFKSPSNDQIPPELIQARCNILHSEIHKHINSV
jgi:hypothetical protein